MQHWSLLSKWVNWHSERSSESYRETSTLVYAPTWFFFPEDSRYIIEVDVSSKKSFKVVRRPFHKMSGGQYALSDSIVDRNMQLFH